jgi:predicted DNA-binding protein (MmcQ/YjbR family)
MNIEELRDYCIAKPGVTEEFPFDETTLVFKVMGKMFVFTNLEGDWKLNLKCDPLWAMELRERYPAVQPGYYMNKMMWNSVVMDGSLKSSMVLEMIDHSYQQVVNKLTKKLKEELKTLTEKDENI